MTDYKNQNHSFNYLCHIGWRYKHILQLVFVSFSGCTSGQQQFFRIPPSDVSAAIGQTTIISCVVGSQAGRVQWTKGGLTLGKHFNTALSNSNQRKLEKSFANLILTQIIYNVWLHWLDRSFFISLETTAVFLSFFNV